jgi:Domain of unknown function (DUF397)
MSAMVVLERPRKKGAGGGLRMRAELAGFTWRKASASGPNGGQCVEVGTAPARRVVGVRDSKNREGGVLIVTADAWRAFIARMTATER